jgi:hypothetical protein
MPIPPTMRKYARLIKDLRTVEARVRALKKDIDQLEPTIREQFTEAGVQRMNVDGVTLYVRRQLWAYPGEGGQEAACRALRRAHHGDMVREAYNVNTLSAWVRERAKAAGLEDAPLADIIRKAVPKSLQAVLNITEKVTIGAQQSK